jgi:hypothetical protein
MNDARTCIHMKKEEVEDGGEKKRKKLRKET